MEFPEQTRSVLSASTKRTSGSRPGAVTVDAAASRAGARALGGQRCSEFF